MTRTEFLHQFHHLRLTRREPDYPLKAEARPAAVLIPLLDLSVNPSFHSKGNSVGRSVRQYSPVPSVDVSMNPSFHPK